MFNFHVSENAEINTRFAWSLLDWMRSQERDAANAAIKAAAKSEFDR